MKYHLSLLALLAVIVGCSSTSELTYVGDLKNEDFVQPRLIPFNQRTDYYQSGRSKYFPLLIEETVDRLDSGERSDIEKGTDQIGKITIACYDKNFSAGFALSDKLFRNYKDHPAYWNAIGTCYLLKNDFRKAQLYYNKSLDSMKDYAPAFNNLGVIYRKKNEQQKAFVAFERAASLSRFSYTPKFNMAQMYLDHGLISQALELLTTLNKIAPNDVDVIASLGTAYLFDGKYRAALSEYNKLPGSVTSRPEVGLNYALAHFLKGDKSKARDVFGEVKNNNSSLNGYYDELKRVLR
ncbi:MAG: tetratricopeptide repeat protein [Bacteriovoracaceae bacterium]|nr:tetratricopeptide repeat protein [Bacteriovoracaceae bacterium]